MMVFQVRVAGLCRRFPGSTCAVEGVALGAMFVPLLLQRGKKESGKWGHLH